MLRIFLIAHEIPYPPTDGGKVDRWNRIVALSRWGVSVHLTTWSDQDVTTHQLEMLNTHCDSATIHPRNRAPLLALHPRYTTAAVSRILPPEKYKAELRRAQNISPDIIFLDGMSGSALGMALARALDIPVVYRSHNVEYRYLMQLLSAEQKLSKKALFTSNILRARLLEGRVMDYSSSIYHISPEDRDAWRNHPSASKAKVLNFYLHPDEEYTAITADTSVYDIDVLYVGNLHTPNNVFGLKWFAREIVPLLKGLRLVIAGSKPTSEIYGALNRANNVQVIANPKEVLPLYRRARVLVNPVWHGSGLNIKMVEALATGKPVVSTSVGTRGLIKHLRAHVHVANDAESFASAILGYPGKSFSARQQDDVAKEHGWTNVAALVQDLNKIVSYKR